MENTGRIVRALTPTARRILYGAPADGDWAGELDHLCQVDRAHLVMLVEVGLIDAGRAARLLKVIDELRAGRFAPLQGRPVLRGLYLLYEDYLIERLGVDTGGVLQTARSRNDLNATVLRLRLRSPYLRVLNEALRLQAILCRRARRFADVVMPVYTHYQAAVPGTFGHYLAGVAVALGRDLAGLMEAGSDLNRCPLGAGAVGGTSLAIDSARTASLLGFDQPVVHSIDAVASRDVVLRLLASAAILGISFSRLATDLLLWSTAEFGFLEFPDQLVGSSSMMPQKRNPFLLEHVQGRSASALGAFMTAATAMHAKPFTNSVAVGTEATEPVWAALRKMAEAATLTRLIVAGSNPVRQTMLQGAVQGFTSATELANRLMVEGRMSFRAAHRMVGSIIREAGQQTGGLLPVAAWQQVEQEPTISLQELDPTSITQRSIYGGGPGPASLNACLEEVEAQWSHHWRRKRDQTQKWRAADAALDAAVRHLCINQE
jgi:argininosuccinate lyase